MGAVPNAEMMEVNVEKLFRVRHFCFMVSNAVDTNIDKRGYLHQRLPQNA
jgi:hypothetical protein